MSSPFVENKKVHGSSALSMALKAPGLGPAATCSAVGPAGQHAPHCRPSQTPAPKLHPTPSLPSPTASKLLIPRVNLPNIIPFWSCFTSRTGTLGHARTSSSVVSAEVGIRPSFYWLDADISEEERLYAEANARWMKSDCQDDVVVVPNFANVTCQVFAGVFDGHGPYGRMAAKCASTQLPSLLAGSLAMVGRVSDRKRLRAMREACAAVDASMRDPELCGFDASLSGTTACFAVVCGRKVYLANTGDSRCVLARRGPSGGTEAVQMTWDAKPDHPEELKRIRRAGGEVLQLRDEHGERVGAHRVFRRGDDVLPGLAMSRSLGDLYAHAVGVTNEPVLSTYTLGERDLFLVLGTDGLWDIMSNEDVVDFIQRYRNGRAQDLSCAEALTLEAQERWKAQHEEALVDDISVAIIHMAPLGPVDRSAHVQSPLAHAASCNDEANALFRSWQLDWGANPSYHAPRSHFQHLYPEGEEGSRGGGGSCRSGTQHVAAAPPPLRRQRSEGGASGLALAAARQEPPPQRVAVSLGAHGGAGSLSAVAAEEERRFLAGHHGSAVGPAGEPAPVLPLPTLLTSAASPSHASRLAGAGDEPSSSSPRSSSADCSESEYAQARLSSGGGGGGSRFSGAFARSPSLRMEGLGAVPSPPIPCSRASEDWLLLRPIRKAYPSQSGGLCSYKSEASVLNHDDTPRSTEEEGAGTSSRCSAQSRDQSYEGKVRGGLPRTLSAPILAQSHTIKWSCEVSTLSSSGPLASSLDDRVMARLAQCGLTDSPTDSTLSSPYPTVSPVGMPLVGAEAPYPPAMPLAKAPALQAAEVAAAGHAPGVPPFRR